MWKDNATSFYIKKNHLSTWIYWRGGTWKGIFIPCSSETVPCCCRRFIAVDTSLSVVTSLMLPPRWKVIKAHMADQTQQITTCSSSIQEEASCFHGLRKHRDCIRAYVRTMASRSMTLYIHKQKSVNHFMSCNYTV